MSAFFDLNKSEGQFRAVLVLYVFVIGMRCAGFSFLEQDHTLILGAVLTLLRQHVSGSSKDKESGN